MEVTQSNFKSVLPEVQSAIQNCTFLTIDCELTGLKTSLSNINAFDTPKHYYQQVMKDCKEFLAIQYGLTMFRYDEDGDNFKLKSYNFYVFRRPLNKYVQDQRFLCQTSSIDFLIGQGFDFNKLFKEGISYLNNTEEDKCRKTLEEQRKRRKDFLNAQQNGHNDRIPIPEENKSFVDDIMKKLEDFLKSEENELQLPKCNAFSRRLIYQTNTENFFDKIQLETRVIERDRILFATKLKNREERDAAEQKKYEELVNQMEDYIGFSKVIRMIVESGKLVVGHNLLLDFVHTIDKFLTPLPDDYMEFKECASSLFTKVLDTKYMSSVEPMKDLVSSTVLGHLLETVLDSPFEMPKYEIEEDGQGYRLKDSKEHEAGYDSFITGLSFISMWKYLVNPSRDHVFYLTFPKEWTTNNIVQLFSPFGSVYVSWISETSAYVGLFKRDQAAVALKTLSQSETYSIMTYAKRQAQLAGLSAILPSPIKKRKSNEGPPQTKRRKTDSFDGGSFSKSKRSIEPIEEEEQSDDDQDMEKTESVKKKTTFAECDSWD